MTSRKPYHWGAKKLLAGMEVGQTIRDDGTLSWRNLQSVACKLSRDYGCRFVFRTNIKEGYRELTRIA